MQYNPGPAPFAPQLGFTGMPAYQPQPAPPQFPSYGQQPAVVQNASVNVNSQGGQGQPAVVQNASVNINTHASSQPSHPVQQQIITIGQGDQLYSSSQQNGAVVVGPTPRDVPVRTKCALCGVTCVTNTVYRNGTLVWVLFSVLGLCLIWPFCLIPFCCNDCKDVEHRCPSCQNVVHVHKRM